MNTNRLTIAVLSLLTLCTACNKDDSYGASSWISPTAPAKEITVSAGGVTVEQYAFDYGEGDRPVGLKRTDVLSGNVLMDIRYVYDSEDRTLLTGQWSDESAVKTLTVNNMKKGISYSGPAKTAWTYNVTVRSGGLPSSTVAEESYESSRGVLSNEIRYSEEYLWQGDDLTETVRGTVWSGDSRKKTKASGGDALTYRYTYISSEDRQNFNAFLMECAFPVWYAKGWPGSTHLISDIEVSGGGDDYKSRQHIDYTLDESGNILTATRTWSSEGKKVLTLVYEIIY